MRSILIILACYISVGCSTIHTVSNANDGLVMKGSYCENIEHIFSGIQYNWCKLHGTPKENSNPASSTGDFEYVGIDTFFSFLADIIVLPYTIYKQSSSDPISILSSEKDK
tara:strand:+ start:389 stop:721 length:333 start_codon:yes stop_codon:yes gene_type:complete